MDKLKYIKLENEDGSYSNSIPLAVDSDHVDVNGNTLTSKLETLATKTEVQAVASGSPLVASDVSEMIDTTKTYVNTTDGYWYYYDGNAWAQGGVYQANRVADESIIEKTTKFFNSEDVLPASGWVYGKVYNVVSAYEQAYNGSLHRGYFDTEPGEKLCFLLDNKIKVDTASRLHIYYYNTNKEYLSQTSCSDTQSVVTPENAYYMRFSMWAVDLSDGWDSRDGQLVRWDSLKNYNPVLDSFDYVKSSNVILKDLDFYKIVDLYGKASGDTVSYISKHKVSLSGSRSFTQGNFKYFGPWIMGKELQVGDILRLKITNAININNTKSSVYDKNIHAVGGEFTFLEDESLILVISEALKTAIGDDNFLCSTSSVADLSGTQPVAATWEIEIIRKNSTNQTLSDFIVSQEEKNSILLDKVNGVMGWTDKLTTIDDSHIYMSTGAKRDMGTAGNSAICPISSTDRIIIDGYGWDYNTYHYWLYAFQDKNGLLIESVPLHATGVTDYEITNIPSNAAYILVNGSASYPANIKIYSLITDFEECYETVAKDHNYKAMYLGDSITALTGERGWWTYTNKLLNVTEFVNVAVAGAWLMDKEGTIYDGNPVFNGPDNNVNNVLGNQVQKIINNQETYLTPDFIMIAIGTNGGINTDMSTAESQYIVDGNVVPIADVDRKTAAGAFRYCNEKLHELYPNAIIVWCTPIQANYSLKRPSQVVTWGDNLKILCSIGSNICIDTEKCGILAINEIPSGNGEDLIDGLHPNAHGAKKMGTYNACEFKKFLDKIDAYKE